MVESCSFKALVVGSIPTGRIMAYTAELKVSLRAIEKGMIVSKPILDGTRYDLILDDNGKLSRVQVKQSNREVRPGVFIVSLRSGVIPYGTRKGEAKSRCYMSDEIDAIVVYLPKIDKYYWISPELFHGRVCISIRMQPTKNNQAYGIVMGTDVEW